MSKVYKPQNNLSWILFIVVLAQFCGTSLWFAGNGVMNDLLSTFHLEKSALGHLTSAVQFGFISGSFLFALLTIADRFSPSRVFFMSALSGAIFNLGTIWSGNTLFSLIIFRFLVGFSLAGIYPVGMKIIADYYKEGLGKSLSFLVGAVVLGTAFPHLLKDFTGSSGFPWRSVLFFTSSLAFVGGLLILFFVPDGPYRKQSNKLDLSALFTVFRNRNFRAAAFGYFGHMWELYSFWAFLPVILGTYSSIYPQADLNISTLSFLVIGSGGLACFAGGFASQKIGVKKTASLAIFFSGLCCLVSPAIFFIGSPIILIGFLVFWGWVVVADSPLFSTLVAGNVEAETKGTALTIVNSIGFAITIVSIQLINFMQDIFDPKYIYLVLAIGPIFGLISLNTNNNIPANENAA
ncbi:MAG: MFS transporter [Calditrichaeota bacterium]|nr:MAG: MFS transporter [Calditrichota bacterium]MBL1207918.1 MFS transporter [Calditrichota bacterium]NOG47753.1 MFS transporter [Calditrichota bacterium]